MTSDLVALVIGANDPPRLSRSLDDQQHRLAPSLGLGARHSDVGQLPEEGHVVLADPEDNEFCVKRAWQRIPRGLWPDRCCGLIGAVACDGAQAVGYFWTSALGWPLVWDQNGETAIRSPHGGPKITWGGHPFDLRSGMDHLHLDIAPGGGSDWQSETDRLVRLGATRLDARGHDGSVVMADPDGNEFTFMAPAMKPKRSGERKFPSTCSV